ncbi:MAG TPA: response regulator transcription factor [Rhizomicrobium sp.]|jgi:two-component system OmpR family response regulator
MVRTLIVEDDAQTALYLTQGLSRNGHTIYWAPTGGDGFVQARSGDYDLIIADRMLPGMDGLTLIRRLRDVNIQTPVLFLTNMGELDARVEGLEAGGDDYITKPFAMPELLARTNALVRRAALNGANNSHTILRISSLEMNLLTRTVTREGTKIDLQAQEFKLLQYLMEHHGRVVTRTMLLENVWGLEFVPGTTVVESHVSRLRSKIDKGYDMTLIHTVRGAGYVLRAG